VIKFVLQEKRDELSTISANVTEFLRGVCFKDPAAEAETFRLLKPLFASYPSARAGLSTTVSDLQSRAVYITAVIKRKLEGFFPQPSLPNRREELNRLLLNAVFSALFAEAHYHNSLKCAAFVLSTKQEIPQYWAPAELHEELRIA
jgi:hypothetical protein